MRFNTAFIIITSLTSLLFSPLNSAQVYSWVDDSGNTIYSDQKPYATAKPLISNQTVNYINLDQPNSSVVPFEKLIPINTLSTLEAVETSAVSEAMTEAQCQQDYGIDCDKITHWKKRAIAACGNDERCKDEGFLDRKYRPRSIKESQKIANRSAARKNIQSKKIAQFLTKKYTHFCENQAAQYCNGNRDKNCSQKMLSYCDDTRSLNDIFSRYDNLSVNEKKKIIDQAKALAKNNSNNPINYDKLISSLIDILISQATLGL